MNISIERISSFNACVYVCVRERVGKRSRRKKRIKLAVSSQMSMEEMCTGQSSFSTTVFCRESEALAVDAK